MRAFFPNISLAVKCQILFSVAVLLILAATLFTPWVQMTGLSTDLDKRRAERVATAAYLLADAQTRDWKTAQEQLNARWPAYSRQMGFPLTPPRILSTEQAWVYPEKGFVRRAVKQLQGDRTLDGYWDIREENGQKKLRFALPIRTGSTDPRPGTLRGMVDVSVDLHTEQAQLNTIVLIVAGASGGLAAVLVFYLITQKLILSPVRDLRKVADQVAEGDLGVRAEIETGDEYEALSDAFNHMLSSLQDSQGELEKINKSLDARVGKLEDENVVLDESNRLKNEFIGNVSHELRTPLVSIIGFAELLHDAQDNPPKNRDRLKRYAWNILSSGRDLLAIINDLLDLARIEAGKLRLHIAEFQIADVCQGLMDFVQPIADKRQQSLAFRIAEDLPAMNSDSGKIRQIMYNLLSNALKFTPPEGRIAVVVERDPDGADRIRLSVSDTGPGIPLEEQETVFEKFKQMDASVTREYGGAGLGLAISKDLVQILGGEIQLRSEVGIGSTFTVILPTHPPEEALQIDVSNEEEDE